MNGRTGVILDKDNAIDKRNSWNEYGKFRTKYVILEMTIKGDLYDARFDRVPTVIGTTIVSMKLLKENK